VAAAVVQAVVTAQAAERVVSVVAAAEGIRASLRAGQAVKPVSAVEAVALVVRPA
jgi:hypothetical protein